MIQGEMPRLCSSLTHQIPFGCFTSQPAGELIDPTAPLPQRVNKILLNSGSKNRGEFDSPQAELTDVISSSAEDQHCDMRVFLREEQDNLSARHLQNKPGMHIPDIPGQNPLLPQMSGAESHKKSPFTCPIFGGLQVALVPGGDCHARGS